MFAELGVDADFLRSAALTFFVAIDPLALAPIFLSITSDFSAKERRGIAIRAVLIAYGILLACLFGGEALLSALGIGMPAFRIAGGLLLFWIAAEMVFERRQERKAHSAEQAVSIDHIRSIAAFPLAMPLIAGPGSIAAVILQASHVEDTAGYVMLVTLLTVVLASCLVAFLLAGPIDRLLGTTGRIILSRLLGVLLAALAVQIIGDGILAFAAF